MAAMGMPGPFRAVSKKSGMQAAGTCSGDLVVKYGGHPIGCDQIVTPDEADAVPTVMWAEADPKKLFLLVMVDPDAPNPAHPSAKWWRHWFMVDLLGIDLNTGVSTGKTPTPYHPPAPPAGPPHRYQFLLYEQSGPASDTLCSLPGKATPRPSWNLDEFVKDNKLKDRLKAQFQFKSQKTG